MQGYLDLIGPTCTSYSSKVKFSGLGDQRSNLTGSNCPVLNKLRSTPYVLRTTYFILFVNLYSPEPLETCPITVLGSTGH